VEGFDVVEKGGLVDAGVEGAGDAAGGEDFSGEDMEERWRMGRPQQSLKFLGIHGEGGGCDDEWKMGRRKTEVGVGGV
jgi:hypothetical protein